MRTEEQVPTLWGKIRKLLVTQAKKDKDNEEITIVEKEKPQTELVTIPGLSRLNNFQILAPSGVDTSILLLNMIEQDITNENVGVCVIEPFADLAYKSAMIAEKNGRKYYYINPGYEHTHSFNPLEGDNIIGVSSLNVEAFVASLDKGATAAFYINIQSNALNVAITALKMLRGDDVTYIDVNDLLNPSNSECRLAIINQLEKNGAKSQVIKEKLEEYHAGFANEEMFDKSLEYYKDLHAYLDDLINNEHMARIICHKSTFSVHEAISKGEAILMSAGSEWLHQKLSSTLGRLLTLSLKNEALKRQEENERGKLPLVALYIDEFPQYISEGVIDLLTMARKARFSICIAHHDLGQLRAYNPDSAKIIYNQTRQKIIYGVIDFDDCEFIAKQTGIPFRDIYNLIGSNQLEGTPDKVLCKLNDEDGMDSWFFGSVPNRFFLTEDDSIVLNAKTLNINGAVEQSRAQ